MVGAAPAGTWRTARRSSARQAIVDAAWATVGEEGLAGLSLRDLARRAGITPPTVYAYFEGKHAIYDAMFGQAAAQFLATMSAPYDTDDPRRMLVAGTQRFFAFCTGDPPRYQLLFQRTLPGFEPSEESYGPAVRALSDLRELLARNGVTDPHHVDLWTALLTGLADQQMSNDPGGDRWTSLAAQAVDMFLAHGSSVPGGERPGSGPSRDRRSRT